MLVPLLLSVGLALASPISVNVKRDVPDFLYDGDPGWSVPIDTFYNSLNCPLGVPQQGDSVILLIHGTMASGSDTWNNTWVPAVVQYGYTACYLELGFRAGIDMQASAEYIAWNMHYLEYLSGNKVAVITHSQGGPDTQWALSWFPSTRGVVSMFLSLSPDFLGVTWAAPVFNTICPAYMCQPSIWQQMLGSRFTQALRVHDFEALVPQTSTWTLYDEIVTPPNENAILPGNTVIGVQDVCPEHVIDHIYIVIDAVSFAIMHDALQNGGTASLERILANTPDVCSQLYAPGMEPTAVTALTYAINGATEGFILGTDRVPSEPPLMPYVYGSNANS